MDGARNRVVTRVVESIEPMRRANLWPVAFVAVLVVALAALAVLQVRWTREVAAAAERRTRDEMDRAARRLSDDVAHELFSVVGSFALDRIDAAELALRFQRWRAAARDPHLIREIFIVDTEGAVQRFDIGRGTLQATGWPPSMEPLRGMVRERELPPFNSEALAFVLPIRPFGMRVSEGEVLPKLVIPIDGHVLFDGYTAELARRYFGPEFDVAIANGNRILYRSSAQWPSAAGAADADFARPLLAFAPRERRPLPRPETGPLLLLVRHRGEPLAQVFAAKQRRDLAVAFGILLLLAASLVTLAIVARRADRLRRQQLEFVAGVTHELHTPLAAMAAAGQNLADGVSVDVAKYGEAIVKEARRLTDLVDEVLEFSGVESGRRSVPVAPVDVQDVIRDAVAQCDALAAQRGVRIENEPATVPPARCDRAAMTRAVQNLVANAIRHGGDGGWVGVRASAANGNVLITVADRGAGIAGSDLPHLFEPFYRGRNAQARGSGLGLAIVDRVARAHGGSVAASNRADGGAEFILRLPAAS